MKVLHVTEENAATGRTEENGGYGDMTPPRSLGRCRSCRSAAAGVTCTRIRAKAYGMTSGAERSCVSAASRCSSCSDRMG